MGCTRVGTIVKQQGGRIRAIKVTCRSWGCDSCRNDRSRQLIGEAQEGAPERFITLSVNPNWFNTPEERARRLVAAWRLIRRRFLKMRPNAQIEFMAVFERTKKGEPHLHIVQRGSFIPQKWLAGQMAELMGAPVVDIRYIRSKKTVAFYIFKYIGKEPFQFGTLKRYWRSKRYLSMTAKEKKALRNKGARFYVIDYHWKTLFCWIMDHHKVSNLQMSKRGFEMDWPAGLDPPWCLAIEPLYSK